MVKGKSNVLHAKVKAGLLIVVTVETSQNPNRWIECAVTVVIVLVMLIEVSPCLKHTTRQ